jgi:hypothetical protein
MAKNRAGRRNEFAALQNLYQLKSPSQIKQRIIWLHLQAIIIKLHGNDKSVVEKLKMYDRQFRMAEREEIQLLLVPGGRHSSSTSS